MARQRKRSKRITRNKIRAQIHNVPKKLELRWRSLILTSGPKTSPGTYKSGKKWINYLSPIPSFKKNSTANATFFTNKKTLPTFYTSTEPWSTPTLTLKKALSMTKSNKISMNICTNRARWSSISPRGKCY